VRLTNENRSRRDVPDLVVNSPHQSINIEIVTGSCAAHLVQADYDWHIVPPLVLIPVFAIEQY